MTRQERFWAYASGGLWAPGLATGPGPWPGSLAWVPGLGPWQGPLALAPGQAQPVPRRTGRLQEKRRGRIAYARSTHCEPTGLRLQSLDVLLGESNAFRGSPPLTRKDLLESSPLKSTGS